MVFDIPASVIEKKDKLFKPTAYDIRAYVGEPGHFFENGAILTPETMEVAGALMASMTFNLADGGTVCLKEGNTIVIGHDNGPTSKALSDAFSKGLIGQGINVYYIGVASSGQVYHNQRQLNTQGHVQITRSHVEVTTNGAKFAIGNCGIHTYLLAQMNAAVASGKAGREAKEGKIYDKIAEGKKLYTQRMLDRYGAYFASHPRHIAVNLFGGTAVEYKEMFLKIFGSNTVVLGDKLNVNEGSLLADPTRKEMLVQVPGLSETLAKGIRVYSFDLDADRLSVSEGAQALEVTGEGHYLGDNLAYILAAHKLTKAVPALITQLEDKYGRQELDQIHEICATVYVDPRYSSGVRAYVLKNGGLSEYHRKGHSLWKETMTANLEKLAVLAGYNSIETFVQATKYQDIQIEASLHLFTSDIDDGSVRDDGIESVFILEKMMDELEITSMKKFFAAIPKRFVTKEIRTNSASNELKEKITYTIIDRLKKLFNKESYSLVEFDGQLRVDWETGFLMYGMSNTSPKLTFMAEGSSIDERNAALAYILAMHNAVKAETGDNTPMDLSENSFFTEDKSFAMAAPDAINFNEPHASAFAKDHRL